MHMPKKDRHHSVEGDSALRRRKGWGGSEAVELCSESDSASPARPARACTRYSSHSHLRYSHWNRQAESGQAGGGGRGQFKGSNAELHRDLNRQKALLCVCVCVCVAAVECVDHFCPVCVLLSAILFD